MTPKIKDGYKFVLDESASNEEEATSPYLFNVPNPPSEAASEVTRDQIRDAVRTHRQSGTNQINNLPKPVRDKLLSRLSG